MACGGGDTDPSDQDYGIDADATNTTDDSSGDVGDVTAEVLEPCEADIVGVPISGSRGALYGSDPSFGKFLQFVTRSDSVSDFDRVRLEWWLDFGATKGPRTFTYDEIASECATCVIGNSGCNEDSATGEVTCNETYMITAGTLDVTAMDIDAAPYNDGKDRLEFTLTDARFVEAALDPSTYAATPVPGGKTWCVDTYIVEMDTIMEVAP